MTARSMLSRPAERGSESPLRTWQADLQRARLLAEAERHAATIASCSRVVASDSAAGTTDLRRAMNALRMYCAREALEEVDSAVARLDAGDYGFCQACERPIPDERLAALPHARFCAACPTSTAAAADGSVPTGPHGATAS